MCIAQKKKQINILNKLEIAYSFSVSKNIENKEIRR